MRKLSLVFLALVIALIGLVLAGPAMAQTTILTFPDPAITNFRLTTASINYDSGGTQPWIRIDHTLHAGDVIHISGQADISSGYLRLVGCGAASASTITGSDPFSDEITCASDGSYVQITGQSIFTIAHINSLTVTVTPAG